MFRLRYILCCLSLLAAVSASGQNDEELYYPYATEDELCLPMVESDTSYFYRAEQQPRDLYGELMRYGGSFVAADRRGEPFYRRQFRVGELPVSYANYASLRLAGADELLDEQLSPLFGLVPEASHKLSLRLADRNYRVALRYTLQMPLPREWSMALAVEGRTGRDLRMEGVRTHALRLGLQVEKRWGEWWGGQGSRLALLLAASPAERALRGATTGEAFRLVGDNYYNPSWGFCEGQVRSARVRREAVPWMAVHFERILTETTTLCAEGGIEAGIRLRSSLGWFDARSPLPDNYRSLPSFFEDAEAAECVADRWRSGDSRYTQIDWDELIRQNRMAAGPAVYIEQDRVECPVAGALALYGTTCWEERSVTLRYGAAVRVDRSRSYKRVRDLLGAGWLTDCDYYLIDDDTYSNRLANDLHHPLRRVGEGGRFGFDYALLRQEVEFWTEVTGYWGAFALRGGAHIGECRIRRRGYFEKELFPGEKSFGRSRKISFTPYEIRIVLGYAFSLRSFLELDLTSEARVPEAEDCFLQPEYNNRTVDSPVCGRRHRAELAYRRTSRDLTFSVAGYVDCRTAGTEVVRCYDDLSGLFCDRVTSGLATTDWGVEAAATLRLGSRWRMNGTLAAVRSRYAGNPVVTLYADTDNRVVDAGSVSYMGGCRPGARPELFARLEAGYFGRGWGARIAASGVCGRYVRPDFMRRTVRVALQAADSPEALQSFAEQERLSDVVRLDLFLWKSFRLGAARLTASLSVQNLTGDDASPYDGYESYRLRRLRAGDSYTWRPFDNRRTYAAPRSFSLSLSAKF